MTDEQQQRYLLEIARRMRGAEAASLRARAHRLIDKWESGVGAHPRYTTGWRTALAGGPDAIEAIARGTTDEAAALRHCMPFAGVLTNAERAALRRQQA